MAPSNPAKKPASVNAPADDKPSDATPIPADDKPEPTPAPTPASAPEAPVAESKTAEEAQDIEALLSRHTFDGKGDNAVPPEDFRGYATEGVEKSKLKSAEEVAQEVLNGTWGASAQVVAERLHAAGYNNIDEIEKEYNRRVKAGAPKAF